jgi:glyoxylase-like metal-dependent hydrolase (beta-lactamase superfamily II)
MNRLRWMLGLCLVMPGLALARPACQPHEPVPWQALAPGIWVWAPEQTAEVSPANGGHVMPVTALVHRGQAMVIDPGPNLHHGQRLRDSLACRFGARVTRVLNSHAHSENVLANAAFEADAAAGRVRIEALAGTRETMALRCPACLESLTGHAGVLAMAGTRIVLPTHSLVPGQVLRFGPHRLQVRPAEQGHTASDLVLWSARERILWAGGLVYGQRLPELAQGRLDDWLAALDRLAALHPATVVGVSVSRAPAAGGLPPALVQTREYLAALREGVWRAMDAGEQPQTPGLVDLPVYRGWAGYAERHEFNRLRVWRELEPLWMGQGSEAAPAASPSPEQVGR